MSGSTTTRLKLRGLLSKGIDCCAVLGDAARLPFAIRRRRLDRDGRGLAPPPRRSAAGMPRRGGPGDPRALCLRRRALVAPGCAASSCGSSTSAGFPAARTSSSAPSRRASSSRRWSAFASTTTTCCAFVSRDGSAAYPPPDDDGANRYASLGTKCPRLSGLCLARASGAQVRRRRPAPVSSVRPLFHDVESLEHVGEYDEEWEALHENWFANPNVSLFRVRRADDRASKPDATVIDIGAGRGELLSYLHQRNPQFSLTGLDASLQPEIHGVEVVRADINSVDLGDRRWDVAVTLATIEHVADVGTFAARLRSLLVPGGLAIVTTNNDEAYHTTSPASSGGWATTSPSTV